MGIPIDRAVHVVGGLMLENLIRRSAVLVEGGMRLPESTLNDPELYDLALNEFRDLVEECGGTFDDPPSLFRAEVLAHLTHYLERKGILS